MNAKSDKRTPVTRAVILCGIIGLLFVASGLAGMRLTRTVSGTGVIEAREEYHLFSPVDGRLARLSVTNGALVKAGEELAVIEDTTLQLRLASLEREVAALSGSLDVEEVEAALLAIRPAGVEVLTATNRQARLGRIMELQHEIASAYAAGHVQQSISDLERSRQEIESLRTELEFVTAEVQAAWQKDGLADLEKKRARTGVEQVRQELRLARLELDLVRTLAAALNVAAPADGRVVFIPKKFAGMPMTRGELVLKMTSPGNAFRARVQVGQKNIDLVQPGSIALLSSRVFQSWLNGYIEGRVTEVAGDATGTNHSEPTYEVLIEIEKSPYPLVLGSQVDARIALDKRKAGRQPADPEVLARDTSP